jgi:hypothetical protein
MWAELVKRMGLMEARRLQATSRRELPEKGAEIQELWPWYFKD